MSSSIFQQRPESPPPRAPSPELPPTPLPYPHHARRVPSHPRIRLLTPTIPPGLPLQRPKGLHSVRSCDNFYAKRNFDNSLESSKLRTRSAMLLSPTTTSQSPYSSVTEFTQQRPASSPIPSCPSLPHSVQQEPPKPIHSSQPLRHIYLPNIEDLKIQSPKQQNLKPSTTTKSLEKHKILGAACLKLFRIRPSKQQQQRNTILSV